MTTPNQCTMCGNPDSQLCNRCHSSHYCSRPCQKADWPIHKLLCSSFPTFPTPPNPTSKRAIFFPVDAKTPRFVWVKCSWRTLDGESYQYVEKAEFLGDGMTDRVWVQANKTRNRTRDDELTVYVREAGSLDGSPLNRCVIAAAQKRYLNFCWPGPILVMRSEGLTTYDPMLKDVDMLDLRDAVDVLCSYPDVNINFMEPEEKWETEGVRVNCTGEMRVYGRAKYEAVKVPNNCKVFDEPVPGIPELVGMPVRIFRCSEDKNWDGYNRTNSEGTFLHMDADPSSPRWGWAPMEWQEPAGNVVIVRADRKPLAKEHAEALCQYCWNVLQPLFEGEGGLAARRKVLGRMTKTAFAEFWKGYDLAKRARDPNWKVVESPV